ncbi:PEP-CTERM sorting domain-containing protein [Phycisphaera mikurensis]|uniref:PEP-CTERM sorting domain-containing protein n=1 Tax=Phycisphaera mikurensis TaxID=547188 RepID=UPI0009FEA945|nr:PEP-CTERM sorting domain-containing protein [Phycisphaera mikurensis]MBB6442677.1 hypothetical protein [Phycisphaera mikurensis]
MRNRNELPINHMAALGGAALLTITTLLSVPMQAQVFDTVINLPTDTYEQGDPIAPNTQINVFDGGILPGFFTTGGDNNSIFAEVVNVEINLLGGIDSFGFFATPGSTVNLSSGTLGTSGIGGTISSTQFTMTGGYLGSKFTFWDVPFTNPPAGQATISGGQFGTNIDFRNADTEFIGGEFIFNGSSFSGSMPGTLGPTDVVAGTLPDGSVFLFSPLAGDEVSNSAQFTSASLPAVDLTPIQVNSLTDPAPRGLRPGQSLVLDGGYIGPGFVAIESDLSILAGNTGGLSVLESRVQISGGHVFGLDIYTGSDVEVSGGEITGGLRIMPGSSVDLRGGQIGQGVSTLEGSDVSAFGGEFRLNGTSVADGTITLAENDVLAGTLEDGSVFLFTDRSGDFINNLAVVSTTVPQASTSAYVIEQSSDMSPPGLRQGESLILRDKGHLADNFNVAGGVVAVNGGKIGSNVRVTSAEVTISGGTGGLGLTALAGSVINIQGGNTNGFAARDGSQVFITGGELNGFTVEDGATVFMSGGSAGPLVSLVKRPNFSEGGRIVMSGGTVGRFVGGGGGTFELVGSDFLLDGNPVSSTTVRPGAFQALSGVLEDGTPFIFGLPGDFSGISSPTFTLTNVVVPEAEFRTIIIDRPESEVTLGLRAGQSAVVREGGMLGRNFSVVDATITIEGGTVGEGFEAVRSSLDIQGGRIGSLVTFYDDSSVRIAGGDWGGGIQVLPGSNIEIVGSQFAIDSTPIDLKFAMTLELLQREGQLLTATLQDGSLFQIQLTESTGVASFDMASEQATLRITAVPEPTSAALLMLGGIALMRRRR